MADLRKDIIAVLNQCKAEIQANMAAKHINASGRTSRGFVVRETAENITFVLSDTEKATIECKPRGVGSIQVGVAPLDTLEVGRPAGGVPRGFYYIIKQWTRDKGLRFGTESERQTFAYFAARKIAREGTGRNRQHVQVWKIPVNRAVGELKADIRTHVQQAVINAAQSKYRF